MQPTSPYWFPAKRRGWGWGPPRTWQAWVVIVSWLIAVAAAARGLLPIHRGAFGIVVLLLVVLLLSICRAKGEPPAWRWTTRD